MNLLHNIGFRYVYTLQNSDNQQPFKPKELAPSSRTYLSIWGNASLKVGNCQFINIWLNSKTVIRSMIYTVPKGLNPIMFVINLQNKCKLR